MAKRRFAQVLDPHGGKIGDLIVFCMIFYLIGGAISILKHDGVRQLEG